MRSTSKHSPTSIGPRPRFACAVLAIAGGCARAATPSGASSDADAREATASREANRAHDAAAASLSDAVASHSNASAVRQIDPDGNDDEEDPGTGTLPKSARWEKVGTPPLALMRICDLTPFRGSLYAAHARTPLGTDGATITRYTPPLAAHDAAAHDAASPAPHRPFRVAFDWNRPGEPVKGGGAGQGFLRVRAIDGRLFVADADPPYGGLGLVDWGAEGYVFVSDDQGRFAPPRAPRFRPPGPPELRADADAGARAGAGVLPRAYHVIDVIRYRGALYASTGSVPPKERAWNGPSPGALHRANESGSRWTYEVDYPYPWQDGVWRLTYLVRFKDRLYAGIQDFDGRDPHDFVIFEPSGAMATGATATGATATGATAMDAGTTGATATGATAMDAGTTAMLRRQDARPVRVTPVGASGTLRWWADTRATPPRLYWLAWTRNGILLYVTIDGDRWVTLDLPDVGVPTDVTRFRDAVVLLTDRGLYRLEGDAIDGPAFAADGVANVTTTLVAPVHEPSTETNASSKKAKKKPSPFEVTDFFCTAPLAVLNNELYAGGQRGGVLYRLAE